LKLYHGSAKKFDVIRKQQATAGEGISVPEDELKNTIYFTPDFEFAIAMAVSAGVRGLTHIDEDKQVISFEHPELFDSNKDIFIYIIDSDKIQPEKLKQCKDEKQYIVIDTDEVKPDSIQEFKASEIFKYFKIINLPAENKEIKLKTGEKLL